MNFSKYQEDWKKEKNIFIYLNPGTHSSDFRAFVRPAAIILVCLLRRLHRRRAVSSDREKTESGSERVCFPYVRSDLTCDCAKKKNFKFDQIYCVTYRRVAFSICDFHFRNLSNIYVFVAC